MMKKLLITVFTNEAESDDGWATDDFDDDPDEFEEV